ncbi:hypothetical protein NP493_259g02009 [Ridgeia piscesae]|uniref:Uncharacterized protein n=1 Tax=Ridgeia piscesae TaxID=27915 RepID=A0AAD9NY85_RIDPI|nr:hypothetical protein NP493_259g02009 [Ridgeia piscesae]
MDFERDYSSVWILWVAYAADIWVYPILEVMSWAQRSVFLAGLWMSLSLVYLAGRTVTTLVWGKDVASESLSPHKATISNQVLRASDVMSSRRGSGTNRVYYAYGYGYDYVVKLRCFRNYGTTLTTGLELAPRC